MNSRASKAPCKAVKDSRAGVGMDGEKRFRESQYGWTPPGRLSSAASDIISEGVDKLIR